MNNEAGSPVASTSTAHLLDPAALLSTRPRALTPEIVTSSLENLPQLVRLITSTNLILSGRFSDPTLLRRIIDIGLAAGEEETGLLEDDVRSRLESSSKTKSKGGVPTWDGWDIADVNEQVEAVVGEDSARHRVVRCLAILQQARRRLDTYDAFYHYTPPQTRTPKTPKSDIQKTPKVDDIELDDPWGDNDDEADVPPILDDPWADEQEEEEEPSTPPRPAMPLPEPSEPPIDPSTFLLQPITLFALQMATEASVKPLRVICQRHGSDLYPYRLAIVESIPGWVSPGEDDVLALLPSVWEDNEHESWPNGRLNLDKNLLDHLAPLYGIYAMNPPPAHLLPPAHPEPLTAEGLTEWYASRVTSLDRLGLLDSQLAWVQHGAGLGVPGLDAIGEDLSLLSRLIYDSDLPPKEQSKWSLETWRAADPEQIVRSYLANSTPHSIVGDIRRLVLPYLYVLESRAERAGQADPGLVERMLNGAVLDLDLHLALPCFEASKATLSMSQRLLKDDQTVARLALACLYGSDEASAWPTMSAIFECLPVWDVSGRDPDADREAMETTLESLAAFIRPTVSDDVHDARHLFLFFKPLPFSSLSRALDILDVHLESGEILARYDVKVYMRTLLQSARDHDVQVTLAEKMVRRGHGMDERRWMALWDDMGRLQGGDDQLLRGAFGMLSKEELVRIFLHGLLSAGNFVVAKKVIRRLEPEGYFSDADLEGVVLTTSKEFYMRAETGNIHTGDMKLAYECLSVAAPTPAIKAEQDFVQATSRVASFKALSSLTPAEIRYTQNKLDLVRRVLSTSDDAYRHAGIILDLTEKLGYTDAGARAQVLAMLVDAAVSAQDWAVAREHVDAMIDMAEPDLGTDGADGWGWDDEGDAADETPEAMPRRKESALEREIGMARALVESKEKEKEQVRDVTWRSCLALGRQETYPDLGGRLALLAQAVALCPASEVAALLPIYHAVEAQVAAHPEALRRTTSRTSSGIPTPHSDAAADERVLGSRRAAKAARMAYDLGASLNLPTLRGMTVSPALGSARSDTSMQRTASGGRGSFESGREREEREAAALFDMPGQEDRVRAGARRALVKGVGWLLGAEEGDV